MQVVSNPYQSNHLGQYLTSKNSVQKVRINYIYGYQGSERDDEVKGSGNSYTTFHRMLDPRLGRWFSTDPVVQPWESPYVSMGNNPITGNDPMGDFTRKRGGDPMKRAERYARRHGLNGDNAFLTQYNDGSVGVQRKDDADGAAVSEAYFKASKSFSKKYQAKLESEQKAKWAREHTPFLANFRAPGAKFDFNHVPIDFPKTYDIAGPLANIFKETFIFIGTGGVGAEIGFIRAGITAASLSGGLNYTGQLVANDFDNSKVDCASVGFSFGSGFFTKNPFATTLVSGLADAAVDFTPENGVSLAGRNKSNTAVFGDVLFNVGLGNVNNRFKSDFPNANMTTNFNEFMIQYANTKATETIPK